jgi:hypothetical protein
MFTVAERVLIREYLGYAAIYKQADPRLESAITMIQAVPDGDQPTADEEDRVRAILGILQDVDAKIINLDVQQGVLRAEGGTDLDSAREMARLQMRGRMYVNRLAHKFDTEPRSDCFAATQRFAPAMADMPMVVPS